VSRTAGQTFEWRRLRETDLPELIRIQKENLLWNLHESERGDGFLSVEFQPHQIRHINQGVPVIVADCGGVLAGFLMGTTLAASQDIPILAKMIEQYGSLRFREKPLSSYDSYVYGPVCVDRWARGQGVLEGLYAECLKQLAERFELGVLFIARDNPRSFEAHRRKLGMERVGGFAFNDKSFDILAFALRNHVSENPPSGR
jgi:hypothetical protein